jgi:hypothetical protein
MLKRLARDDNQLKCPFIHQCLCNKCLLLSKSFLLFSLSRLQWWDLNPQSKDDVPGVLPLCYRGHNQGYSFKLSIQQKCFMIRMKKFPPGEQLKVCTLSLICTDGILYSDWKFYTDCIDPYFEDKKNIYSDCSTANVLC